MEHICIKMYDAKAKGSIVKVLSKCLWYHFSKVVFYFYFFIIIIFYYYQKYEKWKQNEKFSINCNHIDEGSYMFIFTREIGHLTLY